MKIRYNLMGFKFRFKIFLKYFFFKKTICELIEERDIMSEIIRIQNGLVCLVSGGNSRERILEELNTHFNKIHLNPKVNRIFSKALYETHDKEFYGIKDHIEYRAFKEIIDRKRI